MSDNPVPTKVCPQCKQSYPATPEYFHRNRSMSDGLAATCSRCRSGKGDSYKRNHLSTAGKKVRVDPEVIEGYKRCSVCSKVFPATLEYFHSDKTHADSLRTQCKVCRIEKVKQQRADNPEAGRVSRKKYYENHKEEVKAVVREYQHKNREKRNEYENQYWRENRERKQAKSHRRKAAKLNLPNTFSAADWERCLDYWGHRCAACGREPSEDVILSPDHWIALTDPRLDNPGTVPTNIVPLCNALKGGRGGCNNSKHKREAWVWLLERFGADEAAVILSRINAYFESLGGIVAQDETPRQASLF
jgi:hypothetical protein